MMRFALAALITFGSEQPAFATAPVFEHSAAVSDQVLASNCATGNWQLTKASLSELSKNDGSQSLQWIARNARTQMDVWWGTVGSELIAQAVRLGS